MASHTSKPRGPRSANWTADEKNCLLQLVSERVHIVESKRNDFETVSSKSSAWDDISEKFHARYVRQGGAKSCLEQWKRMKQTAKTEWSHYRQAIMKTGGGQVEAKISQMTSVLRDIIPNEFKQIHNPFDDDASVTQYNDEAVSALEYLGGAPKQAKVIHLSQEFEITYSDDNPEFIGRQETKEQHTISSPMVTVVCFYTAP
eukprot:XP_011664418.1 PREDICTED: uncharacterized protein LOC105438382 [Strongylocentrotus purpuratus]